VITTAQRKSLLTATLGFALLDGYGAELVAVRSWLSTWTGIGQVIQGKRHEIQKALKLRSVLRKAG
jgi:hypothetical protein